MALAMLLALGGCGLTAYKPNNADEAIRLVKEAHAKGCTFQRGSGSATPYADFRGSEFSIYTVGTGVTLQDCVAIVPQDALRALVAPAPQ